MLDIKFIVQNPDKVKENIKKKFQNHKLILVDEVIEIYEEFCAAKSRGDSIRNNRNVASKEIGKLVAEKRMDEVEKNKKKVVEMNEELIDVEKKEEDLQLKLTEKLLKIPNMIDDSVPIGKDDTENVEIEKFGEIKSTKNEIPHHVNIMEKFSGIDLESARRISGHGFYCLVGDIARLHSAILAYARDFMIDAGFKYVIPPFMIRSDVVKGVMSFEEMENMMYKIDGEDLFLIGTSEHSMIGRFCGTTIEEEQLPLKLTSYSPCFRKEVGEHGIEQRGIYRVHQFEKQEMIVICEPEESKKFFNEMLKLTVDFIRSLNIPARTLECCSGDLADLKVKSIDVEAWSVRQQKFFEVGSCSNLGDAQARRLKIKVRTKNKESFFPHTLNNTVVASPRVLIAFLENNYMEDETIYIPEVLRKYMGGMERIKWIF